MWWYWIYDDHVLSGIKEEWPLVWGPGRPDISSFVPTWRPDLVEAGLMTCLWAVLFTLVRPVLVNLLFKPLASQRILKLGFGPGDVLKFCESGTRLVFYSASTIFIVFVTLQQEYF